MTKPQFDKLYALFIATTTGKIRACKRFRCAHWPITSVNLYRGTVTIQGPEGYETHKYTVITAPSCVTETKGMCVIEIATALNKGIKFTKGAM